MVVRRIISGGQSGVERAALDLAIQLGIAHGGWVNSGRSVDDGLLAGRYRLTELPLGQATTSSEANLEMSDGVLLISRGKLQGEAAAIHDLAQRRQHPCLLLDLDRYTRFQSSLLINAWLQKRKIETLYITGPRENEQASIYRDTLDCFRTAWWTLMMVAPVASRQDEAVGDAPPRTLDDAVTRLKQVLPLKDRVTIANMHSDEIQGLRTTLGRYIQKQFGIWDGNVELVRSCQAVAERHPLGDDDIATVIIEHLARELQKTHTLRVL